MRLSITRRLVPALVSIWAAAAHAGVGQVELWFRAFIPDPANAGSAAGYIVPLPGSADKSLVRLLPTDVVPVECFRTDHRGFSSQADSTARAETRLTILPSGPTGASVEPASGRTTASPTSKVDCASGVTTEQKAAKVDRDHVGAPAVADGVIQVIGQAQATNVIAALGLGPSIDYSFDVKWTPLHGKLSVALTHGTFPATEVYARTQGGSWVPVIQRRPTGSPWNLAADDLGLGVEREEQTVELHPMDGAWSTSDADKRFALMFRGKTAQWTERSAGGATFVRDVTVEKLGTSALRLYRDNDAAALTFLGFQPALRAEILARQPKPSYIDVVLVPGGVRAEWSGLLVTKDNNGKLKELIQPGAKPAKPFDLTRAN